MCSVNTISVRYKTKYSLSVNGFKQIILYNNVPIKARNCGEALAFAILLAVNISSLTHATLEEKRFF
jgi:hypothetical protein